MSFHMAFQGKDQRSHDPSHPEAHQIDPGDHDQVHPGDDDEDPPKGPADVMGDSRDPGDALGDSPDPDDDDPDLQDHVTMRAGQGASSRGLSSISIRTAAYYAQSRHSSRRARPPKSNTFEHAAARPATARHAGALDGGLRLIKGVMDPDT